ncbi:MAG: hypothetical protein KIPDCIKN_04378 [Haliscomenobacter sp.]|nr:hypothetical protein [Haliscomenobacter sp.]
MDNLLSLTNQPSTITKPEIADGYITESILKKERENPDWQNRRDSGNRKEHLQALFLYPAMMVTEAQRELISLIQEVQPNLKSIFDPFMGAASALIAGLECGLDCYGQDINPLAVLLAKVKLERFDINKLLAEHQNVIQKSSQLSLKSIHTDFPGIDRWFNSKVKEELEKLKVSIREVKSVEVRRFLWVTLAETVRLTSNDRISTYKLHRRTEEDIQNRELRPIQTFAKLGRDNLRYLSGFCRMLERKGYLNQVGQYIGEIEICLADSRKGIQVANPERKFDLLVSSPPYGDNKSTIPYGQHSYLPLQWIDLRDIDPSLDASILENTHHIDSISIGGSGKPISQVDANYLYSMCPDLKLFIETIKKDHHNKINKVLNFFLDLDRSFGRIAQNMAANSYNIWTIGNRNVGGVEVPNDIIMGDFLAAKGFIHVTAIERTIFKKKMPTKNNFSQTMKTEKILILRKSGE